MAALSELVGTYFPEERVRLRLPVSLKDRWVGAWRFAFFSSWYPVSVEMVQTNKYLFFDRRRANMIKAVVYGVICFMLTFVLVTLFLGYFSIFLVYSLIVAVMVFLLLFLGVEV